MTEENAIPKTVSNDHPTLSSKKAPMIREQNESTKATGPLPKRWLQRNAGEDAEEVMESGTAVSKDYPISRIGRHMEAPREGKYVIRSTNMAQGMTPLYQFTISPSTLSDNIGII